MTEQTAKTRLQAERLKHHWKQIYAATKIGVEVKTFSRWERGEQVASPLMRQKLSELFEEEVDDSWFLRLKTPEMQLVPFWYVPYERNPYFTDKANRVQHIRTLLSSEEQETFRVAISGLGGIGKTQLALEYAHRYRDSYKAIFWARASTQAQLLEDIAGIAYLLQMPDAKKREAKQRYLVNQVLRWLQAHNEWLLVLDNVEEDLESEDLSVVRLLLTNKCGHILLTTRVQSIANLGQNFLLDTMLPEEGAQYLLCRSGCPASSEALQTREATHYKDALELARLLGGLPLALEQAAAYIQETGCGLAGYKQVYETSRKDVLQTKATYKRLYTDYSESIATTWLVSFRRVEQQSSLASDLLKLFAYLAPDAIPVNMILQGMTRLDANLHPQAGNAYRLNSACQILLKYSLIKRFAEGTMLSVHRLIQVVFQDRMDAETQQMWAERALRLVNGSLAEASAKEISVYLPHARLCATAIKTWDLHGQEAAHLLEVTARAVDVQGWHAQARPLFLRAYAAAAALLGEDDSHVLSLLLDVSRVHLDLGAASFAARMYRSAIEKLEAQFGKGYPEVIYSFHQLAEAQLRMGAFHDAAQTCSEVLSRYTQGLVSDVAQQARTCSLAARIAEGLGWEDRAESYYKAALAIRKQTSDSDPLEVAKSSADLGVFFVVHRADLERAEPLLRQALEIRQQALGHEHPAVAESFVSLAMLYWDQKQYSEAEQYYQQALALRRQKLGPYHPGIPQVLHDLAELAAEQKKDEEAEQYFREMLAIAPHAGGTQLPEYGLLLKAYADFLQARGRTEEASQYQEQITDLFKRLLTRRPLYSLNLSLVAEDGGEGGSTGPWLLQS